MRNLEHVKHVIIKIGSTSLCNEDGQLDKERILKLIQQIAVLKRKGLKVTLVSSGAISSGMGRFIFIVPFKMCTDFIKS